MKKIMNLLALALALPCACASPDTPGNETPDTPEGISAPGEISMEMCGIHSVELAWSTAPSSAAGTRIERSFESGDFTLLAELGASRCGYVDKTLTDNGRYTWRLRHFSGSDHSEWTEASLDYVMTVPKVQELIASLTDGGLEISWRYDMEDEEGFIIRKSEDGGKSFSDWKILPAGSRKAVDPLVTAAIYGDFRYEVRAYCREVRSEAAVASWSNYDAPLLRLDKSESSWYMASVNYTLESDGGEACETGICYGGSGNPSLDNPQCLTIACHRTLRGGESSFVNIRDIERGKDISARLWVRNSNGTAYSEQFTIRRDPEPEAITADWKSVEGHDMPDGVGLYSTVTSISGRTVKAWYAVLDPSHSSARFVSRKASSRTSVPAYVRSRSGDEKVLVMVNGGYFSGNDSYSLVCSDGKVLCQNIKALTRTRSYTITRGAFGIENSAASVRWTYPGSGGGVDSYSKPLPVVDGEAALTPGADFPAPRIAWSCTEAIGGAPVLLIGGELCFDYLKSPSGFYKTNYELLQGDIFADGLRAPRTAIGCTEDGKIILLAADGRNSGGSAGLTLDELARMMKGLGCTEALNLDGGGSTTICAGPEAAVLNSPSDGSPRAVLTFAGFVL